MTRIFDEAYYLRWNSDVARAVRCGTFASGFEHFLRHGHLEDRRYRSRDKRGATDPPRPAVVRPGDDYFSGVTLAITDVPYPRGTLEVRVAAINDAGVAARRSVRMLASQAEEFQPFPVYWQPFEDSRGHEYSIAVHGEDGVAVGFEIDDGVDRLVFSNPVAELEMPVNLLLSPVAQCNLNCIHCISRFSRTRFATLSGPMWTQLSDAIEAGQIKLLRSDYSGDILFDQVRHGGWLDRIISLDVDFGIDTHANNLTEEIAAKLLASRLTDINFSIDSLDPEDYPRIRRGARPLAGVLDNIRMFAAMRDAARPRLPVSMSYVLMRRNLGVVDAALEFSARTGISFQAHHLHAWTDEMVGESLQLDRRHYEREYDRLVTVAQALGVDCRLPVPVSGLQPRRAHAPCRVPWESAVVLGNGDVMACCVPGTRVGSLHDASLRDIWNGKQMQEFRCAVNSDVPPEPCQKCPMLRLPNNFASYAPCLTGRALEDFERKCMGKHGRE